MRRTALLIGSPAYDLTGVGNDVETMADRLGRRGFTGVRCTGPQATRDGILGAYERLIRDTRHGDAVVVYYSGPGGLADPPPGLAAGGGATPRLPFIVPADHAGSTEPDFRGITAPELSVLLARLTAATPNVTVVLDTCHAAHLSRDPDLRVKALLRPSYLDVAGHLSRLGRRGLDPAVPHVPGRPDAVRIVACGPEQSAYEHTDGAGRRTGVFTDAFALALAEAGERPVTWAALLHRIRRRVQELVPQQRPEAEGPALRLLFEAGAADESRAGPVVIAWGRVAGAGVLPLPATDAVVHAGDHVQVRIRNEGGDTVHTSVLAVDVRSRVSVIAAVDPSGVALRPGEEHVAGFPLRWPPGAGRGGPRPAEFVVLAGAAPPDGGEPGAGTFRELAASEGGAVHRAVHRIPFRLDPAPRPAGVVDSRRQ